MSIGAPDFQDYAQWRDNPLISGVTSAPAGQTVIGSYLVSQWASLHITHESLGNAVALEVEFFLDEALTQSAGIYFVWSVLTQAADLVMPVGAAYVQLSWLNQTGAAVNVDTQVVPTNVAVPKIVYNAAQNFIITGSTTIPAATSVTFLLPSVQPGTAWCMFYPLDTSGELSLDVQPPAGLPSPLKDIWRSAGPTTRDETLMVLPDVPVQCVVTNADAANSHNCRLVLVPVL